MTSRRPSRLALAAGTLSVLVGTMHALGLSWATGLASSGPKDLGDVMPALWMGVSFGMFAGGLTLAAISRMAGLAPAVVALATTLVPAAQVVLLAPRMGFAPPIVAFAVTALLAAAAAWRLGTRQDATTP